MSNWQKTVSFIKYSFILGISVLFLGRITPVLAAEDWTITNFHSDLTIQSDGKVAVSEIIDADFGTQQKHGIFRDIPDRYKRKDGTAFRTAISNVTVNQPYHLERDGDYFRIRIGDADKLVTGRQTYQINYTITGVLSAYDSYDELYWNVTGYNWPVPILASSATITLPQDGVIQQSCYTGAYGDTSACNATKTSEKAVSFETSDAFDPGEGLTVALGYTNGMVPILQSKGLWETIISLPALLSFALVLLLGTSLILRQFWKTGRDRWLGGKPGATGEETIMPIGAHETITPEFEPPEKLRPAELGVLVDEKADTLDVSATIVDLAVRGYLTIKEEPKKTWFGKTDYLFTKTEKDTSELLTYEKHLLEGITSMGKETPLSRLKYEFYDDLAEIKSDLYDETVKKKLFASNPATIRNTSYVISVILIILGGGLVFSVIHVGITEASALLFGGGLGIIISGLLSLFLSPFMPRRTGFGRETYRKALGYKLFVSGTEKYRQPFFEKENIFMEVLPYAIVFAVTGKLAKAFEEMGLHPNQPSWYVGPHPFNPVLFTNSMTDFSSHVSSVMAAAPSGSGSGGGGFSGGGFGGGGGGSW